MVQTKEEKSAKNKIWRDANPDYMREWKNKQEDWKALKSVYNRKYYNSSSGHRVAIIAGWKKSGLIHNNYNALYNIYINTTECMVCNAPFKSRRDRHMDHDHQTNLYRQVLCHHCNCMDQWKLVLIP